MICPSENRFRFISSPISPKNPLRNWTHHEGLAIEILAERLVDDAVAGGLQCRKMLIDRTCALLSRHELVGAEGQSLTVRWQAEINDAARELDRILEVITL